MAINGIEWVLIFVVALLLFGPKKLPELGKAVGKGIREFKSATNGMLDESEKETKHKSEKLQQAEPNKTEISKT